MYALHPYRSNGHDVTLSSAQQLDRLASTVILAKKIFNHFVSLAKALSYVLLVIMPFTILFGCWLKLRRKAVNKKLAMPQTKLTNSNEYLVFKERLESLDKYTEMLKRISTLNSQKVPFFAKFMMNEAKKTSLTLLKYNDFLHARLNTYNKPQFKAKSSKFVFLSEKELWENRNRAYQYWA